MTVIYWFISKRRMALFPGIGHLALDYEQRYESVCLFVVE